MSKKLEFKAYCDSGKSEKCGRIGKHHTLKNRVTGKKSNSTAYNIVPVLKEVRSEHVERCPDCGHFLFWERYEDGKLKRF